MTLFTRIRQCQKKEEERRNAAKRPVASRSYLSTLDDETYLNAVMPGNTPSGSTSRAPVDAGAIEDQRAIAEFERKKRHYDELKSKSKDGKLDFEQDVEYMQLCAAEKVRKRKRELDFAKAQEDYDEKMSMFQTGRKASSNDGEDANDENDDNQRPHKRSMIDAELASMRVAFDHEDSGNEERGNSATGAKGKKGKAKTGPKKAGPKKAAAKAGRMTAKKKKEREMAARQASSLFSSNVFTQQASADAPEQPTFKSKVKDDALKELIASLPLENRKIAKGDMSTLLAATKDFDGVGACKSDGAGQWKVKGMLTPLKAYQVLGAAFMRRREKGEHEPRGGLLADQMGLGKTVQTLANIVNGRPPKEHKGPKTTLIVAAPALLSQWMSEIERHTDCNFTILRFGALNRNQPHTILTRYDIVLATYHEVAASYPKNEPPESCVTADQKLAWWKDAYETCRGPLHRTMFLRCVLDEAQAIKNYQSRTSIACRALMANYKWALSGTPILNSLTELYPYFKFLGVPQTGNFKTWRANYGGGHSKNTERLLVRLSQFMIRRTHGDIFFSAPILKLPRADQTTYWAQFNPVERQIYEIVKTRFTIRINAMVKKDELEKSYSNILVLLLRLRQLTAHVLMLQHVIRDLLELEDIEKIKEVLSVQSADTQTKEGRTIVAIRKQLDKLAEDEKKKNLAAKKAAKEGKKSNRGRNVNDNENTTAEGNPEYSEPEEQGDGSGSGGQFGKSYEFQPFIKSLKTGENWEKIKKRTKCSVCGEHPSKPYITSCYHTICMECLSQEYLATAEKGEEHTSCRACGVRFHYAHPCDSDDEETTIAHGTRSQTKKKKSREHEDISADWLNSMGDEVLASAKTIAVKAQCLNWFKKDSNSKIIIYTQFLTMIRILNKICQNEGWSTEEYHGLMSQGAREKALDSFANNPERKILLASLRCGSLGLNLTMASKVILVDPWWNFLSEQQAFCRVFRIGQTLETSFSRLCVEDTVDSRMIKLQEKKQKEIDSVFEDNGDKVKNMNIRDLMRLFGNLDEDDDGRPFILVEEPDHTNGFVAGRDDEGFADDV
ncbi:hypothetical protein IQ07DRAFT_558454 [Pyrenochaeta sp. DS3sAY3a]|nr:hypothetical protein IQ07DRAFT_558454 [Pyrenochaeta sp. DS3sAY3a]